MSSAKKRPPTGAELVALWRQPRRSRAICVLGHVDHGKSSLVDWLLAENGHIPARLAGTLRYLDDTVDEQERGITMRASAITILHRRRGPPPRAWEPGDNGDRDYAITLVDSPGHIDFSHDACAATRLSDGAVVVVDVVEGVRVQTRFALRAACAERLAPILVLNKLDRLAVETADSPMEAFSRLRRVLDRAAKESEIPNFKGSYLGRFPLVSSDFWTSDHLLERSRSADAFFGTRARETLTLKRR